MISLGEYFGKWLTQADKVAVARAGTLVIAVNRLMEIAEADGVAFPVNPATKSQISGKNYGGFRPKDCPIGAAKSNHKLGAAVDLFDPLNAIDEWCMSHVNQLEECGIYIEHPNYTDGWAHWSTIKPSSGARIFKP